jgi:cob(I)alamin adenosyltransferase
MVRLTKIYTRGGDGGQTSLGDGARVSKTSPRVEAYGVVDEANAAIGLARLHTKGEADAILARIQNDLFDLGADLCVPVSDRRPTALRVSAAQVARLEREIDAINESLAPLNSFVLPGGSPAAAFLHLARTITRRAERLVVGLMEAAEQEPVNSEVLRYLNRLSDLLFVLSRHENDQGAEDVLWRPGATRDSG